MRYTFFGHLCGQLCSDCQEDLAHATLRLYRPKDGDDQVVARATADTKHTHQILDAAEAEQKADRLLVEADLDSEGRFNVVLDEEVDYDGDAIEVDVYLESVPGMPEGTEAGPLQVSITTLQPQWRKGEEGARFGWEYCIPERFWCQVRGQFGAWTICGDVTLCETGAPVEGVTVIAFDRDWIQDDEVGIATTDGNGRFRIDYLQQDFEPGTVIDVELVGGPDLYFRVETPAGQPLLSEDPSAGRRSSRENAGPCFCVDLCLDEEPDDPDPEVYPAFTHVGGYDFQTDIDSGPAGTGETVRGGRAFHRTLRLNGIMSKALNGNPLEYKFQYRERGASSWKNVTPSQLRKMKIGTLEKVDTSVSPPRIRTKDYVVGGTPDSDEVGVTPNGNWIPMPQKSGIFSGDGSFVPNHNQIQLDSRTLATFTPAVDLTGIDAGESAEAPSGVSLVQNKHFEIKMLVRENPPNSSPSASTEVGHLENIAINNRLYDYVRHPNWMGEPVDDGLAVAMVNLKELGSGGCEGIEDALNVRFTAAHPNLGNVGITVEGPGGPYRTSPTPSDPNVNGSRDENLYGSIDFQNISGGKKVEELKNCAYVVTLSVGVLLTNGDRVPSNRHDQIAFCKG